MASMGSSSPPVLNATGEWVRSESAQYRLEGLRDIRPFRKFRQSSERRFSMPKTTVGTKFFWKIAQNVIAVLCSVLLLQGDVFSARQPQAQEQTAEAGQAAAPKIPPDQLDSLVAPIALYPDPMLAQVLAASTYPLELIQLQQWLQKNNSLKDKALVDAVQKQPWDPSVQGLAAMPDVVKRLADDIQWTTDLGNAFLAQQSDLMEAVQRMRKKAEGTGNLKSTEQQKVETKVVESKQVIVIEQANPEVVYVPSYNPTVVYGPPVYPYPPVSYPPPGYYAAGMAISFGVGLAMGAAWGGGWGYGCGWGGNNDITINNNNNFNRNSNINGGNRVNNQPTRGGGNAGGKWQHNAQHRGGTPYGNKATANKFGGTTRGASAADRQAGARKNISQQGNRPQAGTRDSGSRGQQAGAGNRAGGSADRAGGGADRAGGGANRGGGGGDRVGNRSVSSGASSKGGAMGSGSSRSSGSSARASSSRGSSSMGSRGGGGGGRRR
jgi:Protein of unknown function (DUF3300)